MAEVIIIGASWVQSCLDGFNAWAANWSSRQASDVIGIIGALEPRQLTGYIALRPVWIIHGGIRLQAIDIDRIAGFQTVDKHRGNVGAVQMCIRDSPAKLRFIRENPRE